MRPVDADTIDKKIREWIGQPGDGDYYTGYDNALCAIQDFIADMPTLTPPNEWVSVEERLPPLRENVLVCAYWHEHWGVYMGWNSGHGWTVSCGIGQRSDVQVSYWMPLPAPPYRRPPEGAEIQPSKQARAGALCGIQII